MIPLVRGTSSPDGLLIYANLHIVDLIDKMIVLGPESRLTIDQCIAHPWLTQIPPGQELFARTAPVLHRKPTLLGSGQVAPSSTYFASSRELQVPGPARVYSPPASTIMTSETVGKGKGKISSVDINHIQHLMAQKRLMCVEALCSKILRRKSRITLNIRICLVNLNATPLIRR